MQQQFGSLCSPLLEIDDSMSASFVGLGKWYVKLSGHRGSLEPTHTSRTSLLPVLKVATLHHVVTYGQPSGSQYTLALCGGIRVWLARGIQSCLRFVSISAKESHQGHHTSVFPGLHARRKPEQKETKGRMR